MNQGLTGVVAMGGSAGAVEALVNVVANLPGDFPYAVVIAVHTPADAVSTLARILDRSGPLPVSSARSGDVLLPARVYVAVPDHHLIVDGHRLVLSRGPTENGNRPALNAMFRSVALSFGARAVGVLLSGVLDDGVLGLEAIRACGGVTVAQEADDALFSTMPCHAVAAGVVDHCVRAADIGPLLAELTEREVAVNSGEPDPLMQLEHRIALGSGSVEASLVAPLGEHSGFVCPDCSGSLMDIEGSGFRCRLGHAWTDEALVRARDVEVRVAMSIALRSLEEKSTLCRKLAAAVTPGALFDRYTDMAQEAEQAGAVLGRQLIGGGEDSAGGATGT